MFENNIEVDGVEMWFKVKNDVYFFDINIIYVGDVFFMFFKYKGSMCCLYFIDL